MLCPALDRVVSDLKKIQGLCRPLVDEAFITPQKRHHLKSVTKGISFSSASDQFRGAGGGGAGSQPLTTPSTPSSSYSYSSPGAHHPPLEDAGVLAPHGQQVGVAVCEAHVGHVTPVAVVHQAGGLEHKNRTINKNEFMAFVSYMTNTITLDNGQCAWQVSHLTQFWCVYIS